MKRRRPSDRGKASDRVQSLKRSVATLKSVGNKGNERGMTMAVAVIIGVVLYIILFSIANKFHFSSHQMVYFKQMNNVYSVAEKGANDALARLSADPNAAASFNGVSFSDGKGGTYSNVA